MDRPPLMKSEMSHRPDCDIHKYVHGIEGVPAVYDGPTKPSGQWGYMCEECYDFFAAPLAATAGCKLRFPVETDDRP